MASNRPAQQAFRATRPTGADHTAVYGDVDGPYFGATPTGHPADRARPQHTGPVYRTDHAPSPGPFAEWTAPATADRTQGHPADAWHRPQATGAWEVPGAGHGHAAPSETTGTWRFPQTMNGQHPEAATGSWRPERPTADEWGPRRTQDGTHHAHGTHGWSGGPGADTGQWDTGQWRTAEWDTARAATVGTDTWEHARAADAGDPARGGSPVERDAAVPTHGHPAAHPQGATGPFDDVAAEADADASGAADADTDIADDTAVGEDDGEWNPTADSVRPVRGRHRVMKQRGGLARSSTVLGVGVIAAVGAGGIATAQGGKPPVHVSVPDLSSVTDKLPEAASIPVLGHLLPHGSQGSDTPPLSAAGATADDAGHGTTDAGEALRERILQQAERQKQQAAAAVARSAEDAAVEKAAAEADRQKEEARKKAAAEKKKAEEAARRKAEAERLARLAKSFTLPVSSYTLTSHFGDPGAMWSSGYHTGLDFAAPTGTPLKAIHGGTVKEAGWSGAYGYRTVIELSDGTELWYCHQSSISVGVGQQVATGQVIGRVGATGNVTGPHLHLEVHPGGGAAVDPLPWLQGRGLTP